MKVSYSKRETKNLGNFESVSVEIKVEDEVNFEIETIEECYLRLENFVNSKLATQFENNKIKATVTAKLSDKENISPDSLRNMINQIIKTNLNNKTKVLDIAKSLNIDSNLDNVDQKKLIKFHNLLKNCY